MHGNHKVAVVLLAIVGLTLPAAADFNRTALLIDAPTADVLTARSVEVTLDGSQRLGSAARNPGLEGNASVRVGVTKGLELALTAYTHLDYVLGVSYQIVNGGKTRPSIAVGAHDIGIAAYVSPLGHDTANTFRDEKYRKFASGGQDRASEILSLFAVASIPVSKIGRLHAGLGRGRYVGFSTSKYINTDLLLNKLVPFSGQIALGLFGGAEIYLGSNVSLAVEADGRDLNAGVKARLGPVSIDLAATKLEAVIPHGSPPTDDFNRIALAVGFDADRLLAPRPRRVTPRELPVPVFGSLNVSVLDANTRTPIPGANLTVVKAGAPEPITEPGVATNSSGTFSLDGIASGTYMVTAEKANYSTRTQQVAAAAGEKAYVEILLEPSIAPVPLPPQPVAGAITHLVPIYFGWDSSNISDQSAQVLREHAALLSQNSGLTVKIYGSCDESGSNEYNLALGMRRAVAAFGFLSSAGVSADRMSTISLGEVGSLPGEPIKHWKNRRCEFITEAK